MKLYLNKSTYTFQSCIRLFSILHKLNKINIKTFQTTYYILAKSCAYNLKKISNPEATTCTI